MAREQSWCALGWSQCTSEILPLGSALSKPNPVVRIYVRCRTRDPSTLILCLVLFWCQQLIKQRLSWLRKVEEWPPCSPHSHTLKHTIYRDSSKRIWSPMGWKQETNDMAGCLKLSGRWNSPYSLYSDQRCSVQPVCYKDREEKDQADSASSRSSIRQSTDNSPNATDRTQVEQRKRKIWERQCKKTHPGTKSGGNVNKFLSSSTLKVESAGAGKVL